MALTTPGFTAETSIGSRGQSYRALDGGPGAQNGGIVPAALDRGQYLQIEDTLFYCYPCMSGGPAGALVTWCCDAVASAPGGMSWG